MYQGGLMAPSDVSSVGMTASDASHNPFKVNTSSSPSNAATSYTVSKNATASLQPSDGATTLVSSDDAVANNLLSTDSIMTENETYIDQEVNRPSSSMQTSTTLSIDSTSHHFSDQEVAIGIPVESADASMLAPMSGQASPHSESPAMEITSSETAAATAKRIKKKSHLKRCLARKEHRPKLLIAAIATILKVSREWICKIRIIFQTCTISTGRLRTYRLQEKWTILISWQGHSTRSHQGESKYPLTRQSVIRRS
jgi:hypothetical protein